VFISICSVIDRVHTGSNWLQKMLLIVRTLSAVFLPLST